ALKSALSGSGPSCCSSTVVASASASTSLISPKRRGSLYTSRLRSSSWNSTWSWRGSKSAALKPFWRWVRLPLIPRWTIIAAPSPAWVLSSSIIRYLARRERRTIRCKATREAKSAATVRRSRFSATRARTIVRPTSDRSSILRSDSTSGSSGIVRPLDRPKGGLVGRPCGRQRAARGELPGKTHEVRHAQRCGARAWVDTGLGQRGRDGCLRRAQRRQCIAQGFARRRKCRANRAQDRPLMLGGERHAGRWRENDDFGVHLGLWAEVACGDPKMERGFPVQRGERAERRPGALARARADPLGDLALKHQDHPPDQRVRCVEPAQDRGGRAERQVADDLDWRSLSERREIDVKKVAAYDAHRGMARKGAFQPAREARVELDEPQPAHARARDTVAQDAESGADFDHLVVGPELRGGDDLVGDGRLDEKVLAARLARPHAGGRQLVSDGKRRDADFRIPRAAGSAIAPAGWYRAARRGSHCACGRPRAADCMRALDLSLTLPLDQGRETGDFRNLYSESAACASIVSASRSPRNSRQLPAIAIIAALSVQYLSDGAITLRPSAAATSASRSRRRELAATPPVSTISSAPTSRAAASVGRISISTTASWKLAARSSGAGAAPSAVRNSPATAVLTPLKLKSRGAPRTWASGIRTALRLPRRARSSITLPPG